MSPTGCCPHPDRHRSAHSVDSCSAPQAIAPIRRAVASSHGIGERALTAWVVLCRYVRQPEADAYVRLR